MISCLQCYGAAEREGWNCSSMDCSAEKSSEGSSWEALPGIELTALFSEPCSADFWEELLDFGKSLISCAKAPSHGSCVEAMLHGSCWRQTLPILGSCGKKERKEYCSWKLGFSLGVLCSPVRSTEELWIKRWMGRGLDQHSLMFFPFLQLQGAA